MKSITGKVLKTKMEGTVIVEIERFYKHPLYGKRVRRTKRYPVHDEVGVKKGDVVSITEVKPISKTKKWRIAKKT